MSNIWQVIKEYEYIVIVMGVAILISLSLTFVNWKVRNNMPIGIHVMGDGIICYTFNDAIDCLQVER